MAKVQSTKVTKNSPAKKPDYELPQEVKTIINEKIAAVEAVKIKRRSDVERQIKELAKWLKTDDAIIAIPQGKTSEDNSNAKKETQDALKKAAERLLKNAGIKADKEIKEEKKEGIGVPLDSQDIQTPEVGDESK